MKRENSKSDASVRPPPATDGSLNTSAVSLEEHVVNVLRLRVALMAGVPAWCSFAASDWLLTRVVYPGDLTRLLLIRAAAMPVLLVSLVRLSRRPLPTPRALSVIELTAFGAASACMGALVVAMGSLEGPYMAGIVMGDVLGLL